MNHPYSAVTERKHDEDIRSWNRQLRRLRMALFFWLVVLLLSVAWFFSLH